MSRTPADNMDAARLVMDAAAGAAGLAPDVVAALDQIKAHQQVMMPRFRAAAADTDKADFIELPITVSGVAWVLAIREATPARIRHACPHVVAQGVGIDHVPVSVALFIDLTVRVAACQTCIAGAVKMLLAGGGAPDDGHCDVCDRPESYFYPFMAQVGMWTVTGNQCESCWRAANAAD